jgi:ADP-heptose:LPS heptosyltransferase
MAKPIRRIALINFGGLGDGILFLPTIQAVSALCPRAHVTLITETRCQGLHDILPPGVSLTALPVQSMSRPKLFWALLKTLRNGQFDAVLSSGSSPMISILLALSGIPRRVGFHTGRFSRWLLSYPARLDTDQYAAQMHMELARGFARMLGNIEGDASRIFEAPVVPQATLVSSESHPSIASVTGTVIAIHPGVSLASVQKNILKAWPPENWCHLVAKILDGLPQVTVVLLGGPDDKVVISRIEDMLLEFPSEWRQRVLNLAGETPSVASLARMLKHVDVLVCVDSAPMHLAVSLGTAIVPLFSPTDPKKLLPWMLLDKAVVRDDLSCRPCLFEVRKESCQTPTCLEIPVEWVWQKLCVVLCQLPVAR